MQAQFVQVVQALQGLLQKKDFINLDRLLAGLIAQHHGQLIFYKFRAASQYEQQQYQAAFDTLIYCHNKAPDDAEILVNLARTSIALGRVPAAVSYIVLILNLRKANPVPALLFCFKHQLDLTPMMSVTDILDRARHYYQQEPKVFAAAVRYLLDKEQGELAYQEFQSYKPNKQNNDLLLLEAQLNRAIGQFEKARLLFEVLLKEMPSHYAIYHSYANCLADCQDYHAAINAYRKAIDLAPDYAPAHKNLSELLFEMGDKQNFLDSYKTLFKQGRVSASLLHNYVAQLLTIKQVAVAKDLIHHYRSLLSDAEYIYYKSECRRLSGEQTHIVKLLNELNNINELTSDQACQLAQQCITENELKEAEKLVRSVLARDQANQWALALLPFVELSPEADSAFHQAWLRKKEYIVEYTIEPPDEYHSLQDYLFDLKQYLRECHTAQAAPLEQTLVNGTQTRGNLFFNSHPVIQHLQSQFEHAAALALEHYQTLPSWYAGFIEPGAISADSAWSVDLKNGGYHSNHIHPMGWLSSVCYISLPLFTDECYDGYLNFGVPNFTVLNSAPFKRVKPEAGKLILFPSFFWHGTEPFNDAEQRLTVACDFKKTAMKS